MHIYNYLRTESLKRNLAFEDFHIITQNTLTMNMHILMQILVYVFISKI